MLFASSVLALLCAGVAVESVFHVLPKSDGDDETDEQNGQDFSSAAEGSPDANGNLLDEIQITATEAGEAEDAAFEEAEDMALDETLPVYTEEMVDGWGVVTVVSNFQPGVDRLVLEFDPETGPVPQVSLNTQIEAGSTAVMGDGMLMTLIRGNADVTLGDIVLSQPAEGSWELDGGSESDAVAARTEMSDRIAADADAQTGSDGADVIVGAWGSDALWGGDGADLIMGGGGADEMHGDTGSDVIMGGGDDDFAAGGEENDSLYGGHGDDRLFGQNGDDFLAGDAGDDFLQGGLGHDTLEGGSGNDTLDGTFDLDLIEAILGSDGDMSDTLRGGAGDDHILAGAGDEVEGGEGSDTVRTGMYAAGNAPLFQDFDPEVDQIEVLYDPEENPNPRITVEDFDDGIGGNVYLDGTLVVRVAGAQNLDPSEVILISQRAAV